MAGVLHRHPQTAHTCLQNSLQQEWSFVRSSTQGLGDDFGLVEKALQEEFLPALLLGEDTTILGRSISGFMVKRSDIAIPDPALTSQGKWMVS